ncbi:hypothetical protein WH52_09745 [Tenacibaculum holothuriorum]|uniref:Aerotolerance regulator N-terminal domain-containing protein n=1 Tax=Tenacibaculum holothuriorum TaxID=1635173 RepID=A0A1Y2PB60_9FLAO|nr:BatA domain-containing protein [Tenacibaculum holothuriorum]OSY87703.1 hypothetical protein WH52_09745 [Tenacibaculum holothuriorum]
MQFKHPEVLYFLALLIIPILVHLFQLQRFEKVPFTNVAFLKKLQLQTRKSSQLKKWLVLLTRILLLTGIIIAFAQPYFSNRTAEEKTHYNIYLNNSLSLDSKGSKGNLLKTATQEIIENTPKEATYTLITNANYYHNIDYNRLKEHLLKLKPVAKEKLPETVFLQLNNTNNQQSKTVFISDFQNTKKSDFTNVPKNTTLIQLLPEQQNNLSIDSLFVNSKEATNLEVNIVVQNQGNAKKNVPISIFNSDKLINKQTFSIEKNTTETVQFLVNKTDTFNGKVSITFNDTYSFDNTFYFSVNSTEKTNVLAIGNNNDFLKRIYSKDEFNFIENKETGINYNLINNQQLVILNQLESIPQPLISSLTTFSNNSGNIILIPNKESNTNSYNALFGKLNIGNISKKKTDSLKITNINYKHPFFSNVFEKRVRNFQYPNSLIQYPTSFRKESSLIQFENNQAFLKEAKLPSARLFWFASPLDKTSSNFTNSPLIVPVFYTIGLQSLKTTQLYYTIDKENTIEVQKQLGKDEILSIKNNESSFIPLQRAYQNKVTLTTKEQPQLAGSYNINKEQQLIKKIAFNYAKDESKLEFLNSNELTTQLNKIIISNSVKDAIESIEQKNKVHWLWKWFLALAIVSLLLEILIIKFFKP